MSIKSRLCHLIIWMIGLACGLQAQPGPAFPIRVSANGRHFEDQNGKPFFYHADTGWLLCIRLTYEEARQYLLNRKAKGFTTIQLQFSMTPEDVNRYGQKPFRDNKDFRTYNDTYFTHVSRVIKLADSLGLLISAAPLWHGCCREGYGGTPEKPFAKNTPAQARAFGEYLGKKMSVHQNLVWIMGGDNDPGSDRLVIEALTQGIFAQAPKQLICYHAAATHSSTDLFQFAPWLGYSMVYTYYRNMHRGNWRSPEQIPQVYEECHREYNKSDRMPFILGESQYEGETGATELILRRQAWWAMTSGATGHAIGTHLWAFPDGWQKDLDLPGVNSMRHLADLMAKIPWHTLQPDQRHQILTKGYGRYGDDDFVTMAHTPDSKMAIAYLPNPVHLTLDLRKIVGEKVKVTWYNPRNGTSKVAQVFTNKEEVVVFPPDASDWVLWLEGGSGF